MDKTIIKLDDNEIEKQIFYQYKRPISIKNIAVNKIVVSNKVSICIKGFKGFIEDKDTKKLDSYVYFFKKISAYRRDFDELNMSFLIKYDQLLEQYN